MVAAALLLAVSTAFHVDVSGQGKPPMVFIPGLASSGSVWDGAVAHYRGSHECHVLTLAGFAGQKAIDGPLLDTARAQLAAYLREHKLEKAIVVGHSLGGVLALSLAAREPGLVGKLVIVDALPFLPAAQMPGATVEAMRPQAERLKQMLLSATPEQRRAQNRAAMKSMITDPKEQERAAQWGDASDPRAVAGAMAEVMTTDLRPELEKIAAPALVIGTFEPAFHQQYAGLKGARIQIHPRSRHFVMLDDLPGLLADMDAFLAK